MSEPMFNQGAPESAVPAGAEVESGQSNRKALLAVGGVVAAVIVAGGAFFLMNSSSSSSEADTGTVAVAPHPTTAPTVAPPKAIVVQPATVTVSAKNPFAPLYPSAAAVPSPTPTPSASVPTVPVTVTPATPTPAAGPVYSLALTAVNFPGQTASVTVNGTSYPNEKVGQTFATYFRIYSVFNTQCAGILYGDSSGVLCIGKPVTFTS